MGSEIQRAPGFDLMAARLRAESADLGAFVEGLAAKLEEAIPGGVRVERARGGLRGPKLVRRISVELGGARLELVRDPGSDRVQTRRARVSGGITLSSEAVPVEIWIEELSEALAAEAEQNGRTRQALERLLMS